MKNKKHVIVIGAGLSGLSCGIYLLNNGFDVTLLEKNPSVGGLCTGWYRQGRYIDGCIHWLTGTKENDSCYHIWQDLGAFSSQEDLVYLDTWGDFIYEGKTISFYRDYEKAEQQWLEVAPEDKKEIKKFFRMVRAFTKVSLPMHKPTSMLSLGEMMKVAWMIIKHPSFLTTMLVNTDKYALRFKNPTLRFAMKNAQPGYGNLFSLLFSYATIANNSGAVPIGGSKAFVERIKNRFLSLNGRLIVNANVQTINTHNGFASGVTLSTGQTIKGDYVVSTTEPNYTLDVLLNKQYKVPAIQKRKNDYRKYPTISSLMVTYEIADLGDLPTIVNFPVEPLIVGNQKVDFIDIRNFSYDAQYYVHNNKTTCNTLFHQFDEDYIYWKQLSKDKKAYQKEKERIARELVERIETQFPQYKGKITILDVFTPVTLERYTNAMRGAYMSQFTSSQPRLSSSGIIPHLHNVYLASQWLESPGGLPFAVASGKWTAIRICRQEGIKFNYKKSSLYKKATI